MNVNAYMRYRLHSSCYTIMRCRRAHCSRAGGELQLYMLATPQELAGLDYTPACTPSVHACVSTCQLNRYLCSPACCHACALGGVSAAAGQPSRWARLCLSVQQLLGPAQLTGGEAAQCDGVGFGLVVMCVQQLLTGIHHVISWLCTVVPRQKCSGLPSSLEVRPPTCTCHMLMQGVHCLVSPVHL